MAEALGGRPRDVLARGREAPRRLDAAAHGRRRQAPVAADQAPRRGGRRPPQPAEHAARVGQERPDDRARSPREAARELAARRSRTRRSARSSARRPRRGTPAPMKAVLTDERFSDPGWIFERKLDGIRCVAIRDGGERAAAVPQRPVARTAATRRSPRRWRAEPPRALRRRRRGRRLRRRAQTSFARLAAARRSAASPVFFYVFDVLWLDGHDVARAAAARAQAAAARRARLRRPRALHAAPQRATARRCSREACRKGWEGADRQARRQPLHRAGRSRDWLKFKCEQGQELVIGGYTAPQGSRDRARRAAARLLRRRRAALRGQGRAPASTARRCATSAARLRAAAPRRPAVRRRRARSRERGVTGSSPSSSRRSASREWTRDGRLRHPRFLGLRDDKPAARGGAGGDDVTDDPRRPAARSRSPIRTRLLFPRARATKLDLARHYERVGAGDAAATSATVRWRCRPSRTASTARATS